MKVSDQLHAPAALSHRKRVLSGDATEINLKEMGREIGTGFIWLRIRMSGELMWTLT
jgi:hypothetical protein